MNDFEHLPWVANGPLVHLPPDLRLADESRCEGGQLVGSLSPCGSEADEAILLSVMFLAFMLVLKGVRGICITGRLKSPEMFHYGFP